MLKFLQSICAVAALGLVTRVSGIPMDMETVTTNKPEATTEDTSGRLLSLPDPVKCANSKYSPSELLNLYSTLYPSSDKIQQILILKWWSKKAWLWDFDGRYSDHVAQNCNINCVPPLTIYNSQTSSFCGWTICNTSPPSCSRALSIKIIKNILEQIQGLFGHRTTMTPFILNVLCGQDEQTFLWNIFAAPGLIVAIYQEFLLPGD